MIVHSFLYVYQRVMAEKNEQMVVTSIAHSLGHGTPYMGLNKCEQCGGYTNPYANHGAGIFTYKTGRFCSGKCWCAYSSTMVRIWVTKHSQFFANGCYISGWWYTYLSEKYEFFSWGYYCQYMEIHKTHVPNHQPGQWVLYMDF